MTKTLLSKTIFKTDDFSVGSALVATVYLTYTGTIVFSMTVNGEAGSPTWTSTAIVSDLQKNFIFTTAPSTAVVMKYMIQGATGSVVSKIKIGYPI
jgi:hypothetical protein